MPMPLWFGHVNKHIFNKMELKKGVRPVLTHVGRRSGRTYRTPLDAHPVEDGFLFILVYGPRSDWVRNVIASGNGRLEIDGEEFELVSPRLVSEGVALPLLPGTLEPPPGFLKVTDYLLMDVNTPADRA